MSTVPLAVITVQQAHLSALALTLGYVGSLYASRLIRRGSREKGREGKRKEESGAGRPLVAEVGSSDNGQEQVSNPSEARARPDQPAPGSRDHPETIRARIQAVTVSTVASCIGVHVLARSSPQHIPNIDTATLLAFRPPSLTTSTALSLALAPILFLGPLYTTYLDGELPWQPWGRGFAWLGGLPSAKSLGRKGDVASFIELRNLVAGPVSEELVFRSCMLALYRLAGVDSWKFLVFATPLWFGVAHAHHAFEVFIKGGGTARAAAQAFIGSVFQFSYTTLFGWFSAWLLVRTGSVWPAIASHVFCNMMGLPSPAATLSAQPEKKLHVLVAYLAGIGGFVWGLRRL